MAVEKRLQEAMAPTTALIWLPDLLLEQGEDPEGVYRSVDLDFDFRSEPHKPWPLSHYAHVVSSLNRRLGQPAVALNLAARLRFDDFPRGGPLVSASQTVEEFLSVTCEQLSWLAMPGTETRMTTYRDRCLLSLEIPAPKPQTRRAIIEHLLLSFRTVFRGGLGPAWNPERIFFRHKRSDSSEALRRYAPGAELVFSAHCDGLELSSTLLDEPIPRPILDRDRLRRLVHLELIKGRGSIDQTAQALRLSRRSFQRRLKEQGITYRRFLLNLRMDLASRYLTSSQSSIQSIAQHLDYSHPTDFTRTFRKHFGLTPLEYRLAKASPAELAAS